jgi:hypothetical protein
MTRTALKASKSIRTASQMLFGRRHSTKDPPGMMANRCSYGLAQTRSLYHNVAVG